MIDRTLQEKVKECFNRGQRFVLTTHVNPDGDGLGSEAALFHYLTRIGKDVFIYNSSPVPANYKFLDSDNRMLVYDPDLHHETLLTADYILILDISEWNRLKDVGASVKNLHIPKICIDHHPPHEKFGNISLVDVSASSTGEIVYDLIKFCGGSMTPNIADAIYTSILTDTGSFRFSNTNDRAFKIAGDLVAAGVSPQKIYQEVYEHQAPSKVKLLGFVLYNLKLEDNGRVAWISVSQENLETIHAKPQDTEGFADYPRVINGVEVSIMFIELEKGRIKVSFRSKGNYVINQIAQKFGGGGHAYAAGVLIKGELDEFIPAVLGEVSKLFD
ncbi:MAG: bifunctional oligoribonuclease/PAP phosphatase NrnA [bacterium]